jgi:hypothetical protein
VVVASEENPPFPVEARAYEEDSFLVLSAPIEVREPARHPLRILTDLWQARPYPPGTVLVQAGRPARLLAVVYDLSADPICREDWVGEALARLAALAEERRWSTLALPLLGVRHGRLPVQRSASLLRETFIRTTPRHLRRLWVVTDGEPEEWLLDDLAGGAAAGPG